MFFCWLVLQSCGLVTLVTSSAPVDTVSLSALNVTATPTVWTIQMRHPVVSIFHRTLPSAPACTLWFSATWSQTYVWQNHFLSATRFPNGTYCPPFMFECKNHVCVQPHWKCDGDNDCGDNSDEELHLCCKCLSICLSVSLSFIHPSVLLSIYLDLEIFSFCCVFSPIVDVQCETPFRFRCDNNRCIYSHELCNSVNDCGDGSDERQENCEHASL